MTGTRRDSGRKGGTTTLKRYGKDQLREWGKLGGRPKSPTYDDIRQQQLLERRNNNHKEVMGSPGNLSELRKVYKLRHRSNGIPEIEEAGTDHETPRGESLPEGAQVRP